MTYEGPGWKFGSSPKEGMDAHDGGVRGSSPLPLFTHGITQRVMTFFASCEQLRYSKRFDSWNGDIR
jgi:hypothetical protein